MSLKNKTIVGVIWNSLETFGGKFIQIGITIILARILAPEDFGVIGLLIIFTELSKVILDSGFSQALIRKQDSNDTDFSTIFYFNIAIGILLYGILYLFSPAISRFFDFPELKEIARVTFLIILINSFGVVQNAKIVKEVNFKILAKRTIIANLIAGFLAIILAFFGYGVWALVLQMVIASLLRVLLLWNYSKWRPGMEFRIKSIGELFPISGSLLISGVFDVIASNIQTLLIGKYYTKIELGYYTQASQLTRIPSSTITSIISNVTFPTLSAIQNNPNQLKQAYRKVIGMAVFIVFPIMLALLSMGENLIPFILGQKWISSIPYFILMCIIGAFFPLYSISQNIILVKGNSQLYLKVSVAKRVISLVSILITIQFSVFILVVGQVIATLINTTITMIFSGREINYNFQEQIQDIERIIYVSVTMAILSYSIGSLISDQSNFVILLVQSFFSIIWFFGFSYLLKIQFLHEINVIFKNIKSKI